MCDIERMAFRMGGACTLTGAVILMLGAGLTERPAAAQSPPAMFSRWYGESLRGVLELEPADALRLERQIAQHPDDFRTRLKLMAYYQRADRSSHPEDLAKRIQHVLWLIQHDPNRRSCTLTFRSFRAAS